MFHKRHFLHSEFSTCFCSPWSIPSEISESQDKRNKLRWFLYFWALNLFIFVSSPLGRVHGLKNMFSKCFPSAWLSYRTCTGPLFYFAPRFHFWPFPVKLYGWGLRLDRHHDIINRLSQPWAYSWLWLIRSIPRAPNIGKSEVWILIFCIHL